MRIQDSLLEPYGIEIDGDGFNVTKKQKIFAGNKKGTVDNVAFSYHPSLDGAIKKIMQLKEGEQDKVVSLQDYLIRWRELKKQIAVLLTANN